VARLRRAARSRRAHCRSNEVPRPSVARSRRDSRRRAAVRPASALRPASAIRPASAHHLASVPHPVSALHRVPVRPVVIHRSVSVRRRASVHCQVAALHPNAARRGVCRGRRANRRADARDRHTRDAAD